MNGWYVPTATGQKCDYCTGHLPAAQEIWIFLHRDGGCRIFCSSACCAGYCLVKSDGQIATEGQPWAAYRWHEAERKTA